MCGISGFIACQGNLFPNSLIADMANLINHRGPDDEGYLLVSSNLDLITAGGGNTHLRFGRRKQSIILKVISDTNLISSPLWPLVIRDCQFSTCHQQVINRCHI